MLARLIGLGLLLTGIYFLGQNIYFTTNPYPYWWRGIAADSSILCLTNGHVPSPSRLGARSFADYEFRRVAPL